MDTENITGTWAEVACDLYPTIRALGSPDDVRRWEDTIECDLGAMPYGEEIKEAIVWSTKHAERDRFSGPPTPLDVSRWVRVMRRQRSETESKPQQDAAVRWHKEQLEKMTPEARYDYIAEMDADMIARLAPIAEAMTGGVASDPHGAVREIQQFVALIGADGVRVEHMDGYRMIDGGERLRSDDEWLDINDAEWRRLDGAHLDSSGTPRRLVKYAGTTMFRRAVEQADCEGVLK